MPAFFIHGRHDDLVMLDHSKNLVNVKKIILSKNYKGNCALLEIEYNHNEERPFLVQEKVKNFFCNLFFNKDSKNLSVSSLI